MITWLRYRWMLYQANRRRKRQHKIDFDVYVRELEVLAGRTFPRRVRPILRDMYGEYTKLDK